MDEDVPCTHSGAAVMLQAFAVQPQPAVVAAV